MEVFGTVGTAVSLLEACGKLVVALDRYIDEVKHAKGKAEGLKEQVLGIKDVLTRIEQVYAEAQTQADQFSTQGHSTQALWFTEIAKNMKEDERVKDIIHDCDMTFNDVLELLERSLGPMRPTSLSPNQQTQPAQPGDQKISCWRTWKAYLLWPFRKKEVETLIGKIRQYVQGLTDLHRTYQERFANRRTQAIEEIWAYTKKKEQDEDKWRREKEQRRREEEQQEKLSAMMKKLTDPSEHLSRNDMWCYRRTKGTCQWILRDRSFRKWKDGDQGCLWLYGRPGTGKTFLVSAVIEELEKTGPVLYVYCDSKCTTAKGILELLAAQSICRIGKRSSWRLRSDVEKFDFSEEFSTLEQKDSYRIDDLPELITKVTKIFEASFIVVDALDECPDRSETSRLIDTLLHLAKSGLKIFLTSREEQFFFDCMKDIPLDARIHLESQNAPDIQLHITHIINGSVSARSDLPDPEKQEIRSTIEEGFKEKAEGGMFLLVDRLLKPVVKRATIKEIMVDLQNLPEDCENLWSRILTSIDEACGKNNESRRRISIALTWLMGTVVPLELDVLNEALKGDEGGEAEEEWEEEPSLLLAMFNDPEPATGSTEGPKLDETIVNELRSLVVYDTHTHIIRFSHSTVQEYLKGNHPLAAFQIKNAHEEVAIYLLRYLLHDRKRRTPLRKFVMQKWMSHLESLTPEKDDCYNLFMELTRDPKNDQRWQRIIGVMGYQSFHSPIIEGPVSVAIRLNFNWVLERMAEKDPVLIQSKLPDHAPLLYAIEVGTSETIKTLYKFGNFGINAMVIDRSGRSFTSPLRVAIESRRLEIVDAVLSIGADIHLTFPPDNQTFLHIACGVLLPNIDVISRLLEHHVRVDINMRDAEGRTPLHYLADSNCVTGFHGIEAFELLINHGSNVHAMTNDGETALAIVERLTSEFEGNSDFLSLSRADVIEYLRSVTNFPESIYRSHELGH